ncbi:MAG: UDP-N-acetylglucosamine 2-epimerase (non-hydrolyzing) [Gemmatimonadales bacterium]
MKDAGNGVPLIDIIAGARPNFMKIAPILHAWPSVREPNNDLTYRLIHTGQHYDARMSGDFFEQLGIPEPHMNLEVGSGTQAEQTAAIMVRYEKVLLEQRSDLCLVVGDVTSTMACAITAQKMGVKVAHVEAGLRSGDWRMPEEINRMVTDGLTNVFFTTSEHANENLRRAGVAEEQIFFVGNTMIDTLLANMDRIRPPAFWEELALRPREYFVATVHRPSNVDDVDQLTALMASIGGACRDLPVVFPVHPRTAKTLDGTTVPANIRLVEPQPYLAFIYLMKCAKAVITDSGGVTEETTVMGVPCVTLRDTTERPETVTIGTNVLVGSDPVRLPPVLNELFEGKWKAGRIPEKWDGRTGERIVRILRQLWRKPVA